MLIFLKSQYKSEIMDLEKTIDDVINYPNNITYLNEKEINQCLDKVIPILKQEKALLELKGKSSIVGDTHGDFETTKSIVKRFYDKDNLIFLGDYIDRALIKWGSIYNITYLLLLKYRFPKKIFLLKGNHESNYAISCIPYEFEKDILQRFGYIRLHEKFVEVFKLIPLMVLGENIFATHGGILKGADLNQLRKTEKNDLQALESITWSDPAISLTYRGAGDPFNEEELTNFLDGIKARVFVRGHDYDNLGFSIFKDRCLTILSSRRYQDMGNGGILVASVEKNINYASDLVIEDFSSGKWKDCKIVKK